MAQEIITRTLCDVHLSREEDEKTEGIPRTVVIDGRAFVIDVCPQCAEPIETLLAYVAEFGRPPEGKARPIVTGHGVEQCPASGCQFTGSKAKVRAHARQKHGSTVIDLRGETSEFPCPHCGAHFEGNQGLAVHVTRVHPDAPEQAEGKPRGGRAGKAA